MYILLYIPVKYLLCVIIEFRMSSDAKIGGRLAWLAVGTIDVGGSTI